MGVGGGGEIRSSKSETKSKFKGERGKEERRGEWWGWGGSGGGLFGGAGVPGVDLGGAAALEGAAGFDVGVEEEVVAAGAAAVAVEFDGGAEEAAAFAVAVVGDVAGGEDLDVEVGAGGDFFAHDDDFGDGQAAGGFGGELDLAAI